MTDDLFEIAPVALRLADCSGVRVLFDLWRAEGVVDLRAHLAADTARLAACRAGIHVLKANRRAAQSDGAPDVDDLVRLWEGGPGVQVLPGHEAEWQRVLVSSEDRPRPAFDASEAYTRALFEHSPVSLWVEDYSAVKRLFDGVRASGVTDFRAYLEAHPEFVQRCSQAIRVLDVNRRTLDMFGAADRQALVDALPSILGGPMQSQFAVHLLALWDGATLHQREVVHRSMRGTPIDVYMQVAILPGHVHDWSLVLVSLVDMTARKRAEAELEYLSTHDSLTGLRNRSFFTTELRRLERIGPWPVAVIMFDLNGLKPVNDRYGHAAGDRLIRRAGLVLTAALAGFDHAPLHAARLGGDEFALLLPATDAATAEEIRASVGTQLAAANAGEAGPPLSFSIGIAILEPGGAGDAALHLADQRMYADKRAHYAVHGIDRRG